MLNPTYIGNTRVKNGEYIHPRTLHYINQAAILSQEVARAYQGSNVGSPVSFQYGGPPIPEADSKERRARVFGIRASLLHSLSRIMGEDRERAITFIDNFFGWTANLVA